MNNGKAQAAAASRKRRSLALAKQAAKKAERKADREEYKNLSARGREYRWIEKDNIIDMIRSEAQRDAGGRLTKEVLKKIAYDSGVTEGTLREWFFGSTRFPRRLTTKFVMEAIGITTQYLRRDGSMILRND